MQQRLEATEMRQHHMMAFLAKAVNNPAFLQHFLSARNTNSRITDSKGKHHRACHSALSFVHRTLLCLYLSTPHHP